MPVELTATDLDLAARGMYVTRVIYVEDPAQALPIEEIEGQMWFEAGRAEDPLEVADRVGRPIAILRIGGRDLRTAPSDPRFTFGCPPIVEYKRNPSEKTISEKQISENSASVIPANLSANIRP